MPFMNRAYGHRGHAGGDFQHSRWGHGGGILRGRAGNRGHMQLNHQLTGHGGRGGHNNGHQPLRPQPHGVLGNRGRGGRK